MNLHQPTTSNHAAAAGRSTGVGIPSRADLIQKLNDARCKWMVTLHYSLSRYSGGVGSNSSNNTLGEVHHDGARNTSFQRSRTSGHQTLVPAADFCPECASIVEVELECNRAGEFVAEHRRGCSACERDQQTLLTQNVKGEAPNSRRFSSTRQRYQYCNLDKNWRLWKVCACVDGFADCTIAGIDTQNAC